MLQIGVTIYVLVLWSGIVIGAQLPQSVPHLLALILLSALVIIPLAPRLARLLLRSLTIAANAPPLPPPAVPGSVPRLPGAPGTPGGALARAPARVLALPGATPLPRP